MTNPALSQIKDLSLGLLSVCKWIFLEIGLNHGFPYHFSLPTDPSFSFRRKPQGVVYLPKISSEGVRLANFWPEGANLDIFWKKFKKKWLKTAIKVNLGKDFGFKNCSRIPVVNRHENGFLRFQYF